MEQGPKALIQQTTEKENHGDFHRKFVSVKQIGYINQILLKCGNNIDQQGNKLTDLNKNDVARLLLSGKFGSINHKDLGCLMKGHTEQAKKTPSSGK